MLSEYQLKHIATEVLKAFIMCKEKLSGRP